MKMTIEKYKQIYDIVKNLESDKQLYLVNHIYFEIHKDGKILTKYNFVPDLNRWIILETKSNY